MLMRPWPATAISEASFEGDDERLNRIKRIFIKTERDQMLDPKQQDSMIKKWPPSEVLVIDTDHSPFFSQEPPPDLSPQICQTNCSVDLQGTA